MLFNRYHAVCWSHIWCKLTLAQSFLHMKLNDKQVNNLILGWTSSVLGQTDEKKAVAIAMANTLGNAASIYTPYLWPDSDKPRFLTAMLASIGFSIGVVICAWGMKLALMRTNRKKREADPNASNFYVY